MKNEERIMKNEEILMFFWLCRSGMATTHKKAVAVIYNHKSPQTVKQKLHKLLNKHLNLVKSVCFANEFCWWICAIKTSYLFLNELPAVLSMYGPEAGKVNKISQNNRMIFSQNRDNNKQVNNFFPRFL